MFGRTSLLTSAFAAVLLSSMWGCSSKEPAPTTEAPAGDTGPAEDTAPWNTYPEGPYGLLKDQTFPNITFKGYHNGKSSKDVGEWGDISMLDYYDPTGERGINAILVVVSAEWCPPCKEEAKDLPGFYANVYQPRGAKFLTTMVQDGKRQPATQPTVDRWVNTYGINFDIVADPESATLPQTSGIPRNYIVNPRTMKIWRVNEGVNPDASVIPGLNPMLDANGAPKLDAGT